MLLHPTHFLAFTGQVGEHVTLGFTSYDLGTVLANETITGRIPQTGYGFSTNDYQGSYTLTLDFQGCQGNFSTFSLEIWRDNAPDVHVNTLTLGVLSVTLNLNTNEDYYYMLNCTGAPNPSVEAALEIVIRGES